MDLTSKDALRKPRILPLILANGDNAKVRAMSGNERWKFSEWLNSRDGTDRDLYCAYLSQYLCDSNGERIYTDAAMLELADVAAVTLQELFESAMIANGIHKRGDDEVKKP